MNNYFVPQDARVSSPSFPGIRRLLRDSMLVGATGLLCDALGVVTSLLFRTLLDPAQMGLWQALKMLLGYGNFANLGVSKGAARELTIQLGQGDARGAARSVALGNTANVLASVAYSCGLLAAAGWMYSSSAERGHAWALGLVAIAVLTFLQRHVTYQITLLRCCQDFSGASAVALLEAGLTLLIGGALTWQFGLPGLYVATLLVMLVSATVLARGGAGQLGWQWAPRELSRLAAIGGPILLVSVLTSLFRSLDRWFILTLPDGEFHLGCYSAALLVTTQLYGVANALTIVLAPRYGQLLGKTGCPRQVAKFAARSSEPLATSIGVVAAIAMLLAPPVLTAILPDYASGLKALVWLIPGVVCLGLALPLHQYLIAVGGQRRSFAALVVGAAVAGAGNALATRWETGLMGIAAATAASYAAYWFALAALSLWPQLNWAERGRYALVATAALALPLASAWLAPPGSTDLAGWSSLFNLRLWGGMLGNMVLIVLAWIMLVAAGWIYGGWGQAWRQEGAR